MKAINREILREISSAIHEKLKELESTYEVSFESPKASFADTNATFKIAMRLQIGSELIYADYENSRANRYAEQEGILVIGNVLGSRWRNARTGMEFTITSYESKRPRYPWGIQKDGGGGAKAPNGFITGSTQITKALPTFKEFLLWYENDGEEDWFTSEQVDSYDRTHLWVSNLLDDIATEVFDLMTKFELEPHEKALFYNSLCSGNLKAIIPIFSE